MGEGGWPGHRTLARRAPLSIPSSPADPRPPCSGRAAVPRTDDDTARRQGTLPRRRPMRTRTTLCRPPVPLNGSTPPRAMIHPARRWRPRRLRPHLRRRARGCLTRSATASRSASSWSVAETARLRPRSAAQGLSFSPATLVPDQSGGLFLSPRHCQPASTLSNVLATPVRSIAAPVDQSRRRSGTGTSSRRPLTGSPITVVAARAAPARSGRLRG